MIESSLRKPSYQEKKNSKNSGKVSISYPDHSAVFPSLRDKWPKPRPIGRRRNSNISIFATRVNDFGRISSPFDRMRKEKNKQLFHPEPLTEIKNRIQLGLQEKGNSKSHVERWRLIECFVWGLWIIRSRVAAKVADWKFRGNHWRLSHSLTAKQGKWDQSSLRSRSSESSMPVRVGAAEQSSSIIGVIDGQWRSWV